MIKYILISGTLSIAYILGGLSYVSYLNSPEPTSCQKKVTEASYVAEIANATGRVPGEVKRTGDIKYTVKGDVCNEL